MKKAKGEIRQIVPGLYRGYRPPSYQTLINLRVSVEVNLETGVAHAVDKLDGVTYQNQDPKQLGIEVISHPLSNWLPPSPRKIRELIEQIKERIAQNKVCYVHCLWGRDRTGFVIAAYRMLVQGWSYQEAKKEMFERGFRKWVYWYWLFSLKKLSVKK